MPDNDKKPQKNNTPATAAKAAPPEKVSDKAEEKVFDAKSVAASSDAISNTPPPNPPSIPPSVFSVLTAQQMRLAEQSAVQAGTPLIVLMERAGLAVAEQVMARYTKCPTIILCGPGNNGGDGFVAARHMAAKGWPVRILLFGKLEDLTPEAKVAASRWRGAVITASVSVLETALQKGAQLVIDALYGIGLRRAVTGEAAQLLQLINRSGLPIVSVDIPSGLNADTGQVFGQSAVADLTICFFRKKLAHVLMPGRMLCGEIILMDVGIPEQTLLNIPLQVCENHPNLWISYYPQPQLSHNKFDRGHVMVLGGSQMTGAARLAAQAAQRIGSGLVTIAAPQTAYFIYAVSNTSILVNPVIEGEGFMHSFQKLLEDRRMNVVLLGPGAGENEQTRQAVQLALAAGKPCVLDADALNVFAGDAESLKRIINPQCIITPHEGEFSRLFDRVIDARLDKVSRTKAAAAFLGCTVVLKGADTVIASPEGLAIINSNAPATLATAGSGDVLAGFIAGLIAQGVEVFPAGCIATWLHAAVASEYGPCLIAEDLIAGLHNVLRPKTEATNPQKS
ncbi:MAG: NAD(P)H-hydrate dehydratase [Alphaproteobacteria bacterium]|nr:NAD(P)H-hydrate dehydratase [Alphaproteobacteria bacterium]